MCSMPSLSSLTSSYFCFFLFFFNDTATTEIYTLSLHDALPICGRSSLTLWGVLIRRGRIWERSDRKSTRLNSSHLGISYAVFCLKKKKKNIIKQPQEAPHTRPAFPGHCRRPPPDPRRLRPASVCDHVPVVAAFLLFFFFLKERPPPDSPPLPHPRPLPI